MNRRSLLAMLAVSSTLGSTAFAQSSDIRQNEQNIEAQRRLERQQRPQYLPGDRRRVEEHLRRSEAERRYRERAERGRGDYRGERDRGNYRGYRADEWRHGGRGAGPNRNWHRGGHLPREYRNRNYVVDDWRAHRLYAPPRGHHWVQAGGDYLLVAIATGLIAAVLLNQ